MESMPMDPPAPGLFRPPPHGPLQDQKPPTPGMVEVNINNTSSETQALEAAIEQVKDAAGYHRVGIMVTRIGLGRYIVRAHSAVPHGLVQKRYN
jgi:hypothetical protein